MVTVADMRSVAAAGGEERGGGLRAIDKNELRVRRAILTALCRRWEKIRDEIAATFGPPAKL